MPGENFPGDRIVSLVDELEGLIEEAKTPFGKNAQMKVIDADVFFNILDEIRMSYPAVSYTHLTLPTTLEV